ncbi:unnamed protein product [Lactuca saligna]|uniref:Small nuclear ribonucleoprotein Sm D2 n=1 Tax=Lactuca saligna TaxID=75948 RepID=A0AA35Z012_LACSI|nr:unnamed protein product [Lactuca saligna]
MIQGEKSPFPPTSVSHCSLFPAYLFRHPNRLQFAASVSSLHRNMSRPMEEDAPTKNEEEEFNTGPLSVLMMSVKNNTQVLINCRNNKKLLERCGLRSPKQEKARRKLFRLTKTDLSARCFSEAILSSLFLETLSKRILLIWDSGLKL